MAVRKWVAAYAHKSLGRFMTEEDAAKAYDEHLRKVYGEDAHGGKPAIVTNTPEHTRHTRTWLNFPNEAEVERERAREAEFESARALVAAGKPSSNYRGVHYNHPSRRWHARVRALGNGFRHPHKLVGTFDNECDAARAYDQAAFSLHGAAARLNFPDEQHALTNNAPFPLVSSKCFLQLTFKSPANAPSRAKPQCAFGPETLCGSVFKSKASERAMRHRTWQTDCTEEPALHESRVPAIYAARSSIHGVGCFSSREFVQGEFIAEYAGEIECERHESSSGSEEDSSSDEEQAVATSGSCNQGPNVYVFDLGDGLVINGLRMGNATRRANHSSKPNMRAMIVNHCGVRKVCFYALMPLAKDVELTFDYGKAAEVMIPIRLD